MKYSFKQSFRFNDRIRESARIINMYPDRIPIICERSENAPSDCPFIDKKNISFPEI